jgi:hypothetical protein
VFDCSPALPNAQVLLRFNEDPPFATIQRLFHLYPALKKRLSNIHPVNSPAMLSECRDQYS